MTTNTNTTNSGEESENLPPGEEKKQTDSPQSPFVVLFYKKKSIEPFILTYPENPLKIYDHSYYRPIKASLTEPDGWVSTIAYKRWVTKVRETMA